MDKPSIRVRKLLLRSFLSFSLPAIVLLLTFSLFTVQRQVNSETQSYQDMLSIYSNDIDRVLQNTASQLDSLIYESTSFQLFSFASKNTVQYQYALDLMRQFEMLQKTENQLSGFFAYSSSPSFYYPLWGIRYSYADTRYVLEYVSANMDPSKNQQWLPLELSDRIVYIRTCSYSHSVAAVIVDPSVSIDSASQDDCIIFFSTGNGDSLHPKNILDEWSGDWTDSPIQKGYFNQKPYRMIKCKLDSVDLYCCLLVPMKSAIQLLTMSEKIIMILIIILVASVPIVWISVYHQLLNPLSILDNQVKQISNGTDIPKLSEKQPIEELQTISQTINTMLDNIQKLKLDSYEQKLDLLQAQVQYLHLQIRPHFYINCLKNIYSLAENREYSRIQDLTLSLSDYFRYIFRDNRKMVPLQEELRSARTYVTLYELNYQQGVTLDVDVDARAVDIPVLPLSILTFVENSLKHAQSTSALKVSVKIELVEISCETTFLNIKISNNNGYFSSEDLKFLNNIPKYKSLYDDYHVGVSNVFYRMQLTYNKKGTLEFYNTEYGACVEITVPVIDGDEAP